MANSKKKKNANRKFAVFLLVFKANKPYMGGVLSRLFGGGKPAEEGVCVLNIFVAICGTCVCVCVLVVCETFSVNYLSI